MYTENNIGPNNQYNVIYEVSPTPTGAFRVDANILWLDAT
jgi:hypothetical protein